MLASEPALTRLLVEPFDSLLPGQPDGVRAKTGVQRRRQRASVPKHDRLTVNPVLAVLASILLARNHLAQTLKNQIAHGTSIIGRCRSSVAGTATQDQVCKKARGPSRPFDIAHVYSL